jgi:N-acetylneuraminate synthase/sialic acid synthase
MGEGGMPMRKLVIDGKTITDDGDCLVIAEVGHNHQGKLETAKEMVRVAKECGADAVKLQKRDNRQLYTKEG